MQSTLSATERHRRDLDAILFDVKGLLERLKGLNDCRGERGKRYELAPLLVLIVLAKLSGEDTPSGIADWLSCRAAGLIEALGLDWPRMPHHSTLRRIIASVVEPEGLDQVFSEHLTNLPQVGRSQYIAIDGKTVRGTINEAKPRGDHLLTAYLPREGIVLGQVAVSSKENEISEAPKLLRQLDLRGKVVMGDAMHAQRELSKQIKEAGGEFIWVIKGNQPTLLKEIEGLFALQTPTVLGGLVPNDFVSYETVHKGHGRLERRRITVSSELRGYANWPYSQQVFRLERQRITLKTGKLETEVVYGLTSLCRKAASAKQLHDFARDYWGIENGLHHRRDVTFNEDRTRQTLGHAGRVMASLNNLAISLFRHAGFTNIAHARRIFNGLLNHTTYLSLQRPLT